MAVTSYKFPTAVGGKFNTWTNATNLEADDGNYATYTESGDIHYQSAESFAFGIPVGATIDGIEIELQGKLDAGDARDLSVGLWNATDNSWGAANYVDPRADSTERVWTLGGATSKFGTTWQVSDFSDANFSIRIGTYFTAAAQTYSVDYIKVRVYYTGGETTVTVNGATVVVSGGRVNPTLTKTISGVTIILSAGIVNTLVTGWNFLTKHISTWTGKNKNTSTWTSKNKNSSSWTGKQKH